MTYCTTTLRKVNDLVFQIVYLTLDNIYKCSQQAYGINTVLCPIKVNSNTIELKCTVLVIPYSMLCYNMSVHSLALLFNIGAVILRPDKYKIRSAKSKTPELKRLADEYYGTIPCYQVLGSLPALSLTSENQFGN